MPADTNAKISSEAERPRQGWLAKCGIHLPVRERRASEELPNRPVMILADSKEKKRKRTSQSPVPITRTAVHMGTTRGLEKPHSSVEATLAAFEKARRNGDGLAQYEIARDGILKAELEQSWDLPVKKDASDIEKRAAAIIHAIREFERDFIFGNVASEAIPGPETRDMGGQFVTNKDHIENRSKLYRIAKQLPKGALLHLHYNAELNPGILLQQARDIKNMYIRSTQPLLTRKDLEETEMVLNVWDPDEVTPDVNIFSKDYKGTLKSKNVDKDIWMTWKDFRQQFPMQFPGAYKQDRSETIIDRASCAEPGKLVLGPAENWLKQKMILSEEEVYGINQTVNGVWARFNQATRAFKGLANYESVYKKYIDQAIERLIEEKVMYAELRPMLMDKFIPADSGKTQIDHAGQMQIIVDAIEKKKKALSSKGELHKFPFGLKIVYCAPRSIPKTRMQQEMMDCLKLKVQFNNLICGFDLVGAEDRPNHVGYYKEELVAFRHVCKEQGLDLPFLFHAGETLLDTGGSKDPSNSNLIDALVLDAKRIGHGFSLMKHPVLVEKFKIKDNQKGICVELCPISNELLHLCRNIKEHPYPELLAAGIPCTVNSDNPSLFGNSMSHEFYQIMVGSPSISLHSWKQLAIWSLEYSCLSEKEVQQGKSYYEQSWTQFCRQVVNRYGRLMAGDKIIEDVAKAAYDRKSNSWEAEYANWDTENDIVLEANTLQLEPDDA
ncbi:Metallo-dependent hydrolase [Corynespora cassiicola Philippines]|uniref:adenosine deaminase n=1 Tax=Corynespora cassiicola Philippines TaxID=1448308 RepID=A0A2T2NLV6_CORCC|nr:Metallo-dependent hydrolase [Corynespora cassiicola Philippines]